MKQRLPVIIDEVDFSDCFNRYAYTVEHIPRDGGRGGMMQDGTMTVDILAWKDLYSLGCNDLKGARLAQLQRACSKSYVQATVYDPMTGETRSGTFIPRLSPSSTRLFVGGVVWFGGATLTLEEK